MKNFSIATIAASALAAFAIGLAAPVVAAPSPVNPNDTMRAIDYPTSGQTPYGTYQNDNKRNSPVG